MTPGQRRQQVRHGPPHRGREKRQERQVSRRDEVGAVRRTRRVSKAALGKEKKKINNKKENRKGPSSGMCARVPRKSEPSVFNVKPRVIVCIVKPDVR